MKIWWGIRFRANKLGQRKYYVKAQKRAIVSFSISNVRYLYTGNCKKVTVRFFGFLSLTDTGIHSFISFLCLTQKMQE